MRRSRSDPSKCTKGYRRVSQRRMTTETNNDLDMDMDTSTSTSTNTNTGLCNHGSGSNSIRLPSQPRKGAAKLLTTTSTSTCVLSAQEIREARKGHRSEVRKVRRREEKKRKDDERRKIYQRLQQHSVPVPVHGTGTGTDAKGHGDAYALFQRSSTLGQRESRRQTVQRLWRKQRSGLRLTPEEQNLLCPTHTVNEHDNDEDNDNDNENDNDENENENDDKVGAREERRHVNEETVKTKETTLAVPIVPMETPNGMELSFSSSPTRTNDDGNGTKLIADVDSPTATPTENLPPPPLPAPTTIDVAKMMMSGLSMLKQKQTEAKANQDSSIPIPTTSNKKVTTKKYVPSEPIVFETPGMSALRQQVKAQVKGQGQGQAVPVQSQSTDSVSVTTEETITTVAMTEYPSEKEEVLLPVREMEFEILEAVSLHAVTIVCGETGSGKSTQVPQMLVEAGYDQNKGISGISTTTTTTHKDKDKFQIVVTQPRRVAAVATAKRIGHEFSTKATKTRTKKAATVGYRTRYESSVHRNEQGEPDDEIMVVTDGILLKELSSDLLLRKYSVVVLDEVHERNLNLDLCMGLLVKALEMRHVCQTDLPPLKVVIMSATLDAQELVNFFGRSVGGGNGNHGYGCAVVKVPGRTFPVTIHFDRVSAGDREYENAAFRKTLRIHRRLPLPGGILVFLTGRAEIDRMVRRLREAVGGSSRVSGEKKRSQPSLVNSNSGSGWDGTGEGEGVRDLDDEELEAELGTMDNDMDNDMEKDDHDDYDDEVEMEMEEEKEETVSLEIGENSAVPAASVSQDGTQDEKGRSNLLTPPKGAVILPFHALLSSSDQSRIFDKVPEGYRLIVVSTNLAETSLTVPGISYVVDAGRCKSSIQWNSHSHSHSHSHSGGSSTEYATRWISRASADQRAGRAGRTGPGHCYRLYSSAWYARSLPETDPPQMSLPHKTDEVALTMSVLGLGGTTAHNQFPFVTPPPSEAMEASTQLLRDLGLVSLESGRATDAGRCVANLGLGVRHGRVLWECLQRNVWIHGLTVVAVLAESHGLFLRRNQEEVSSKAAEQLQSLQSIRQCYHRDGDILAAVELVETFGTLLTTTTAKSNSNSSRSLYSSYCATHHLHEAVLDRVIRLRRRLWRSLRRLLPTSSRHEWPSSSSSSTQDRPTACQLRASILAGHVDRVARRTMGRTYRSLVRAPTGGGNVEFIESKEDLVLSTQCVLLGAGGGVSSHSQPQGNAGGLLPEWICYSRAVVRRRPAKRKHSASASASQDNGKSPEDHDEEMRHIPEDVTPIDPRWLADLHPAVVIPRHSQPQSKSLSKSRSQSKLQPPRYDALGDRMVQFVQPTLGPWELPPRAVPYPDDGTDTVYCWFARYLWEGRVVPGFPSTPQPTATAFTTGPGDGTLLRNHLRATVDWFQHHTVRNRQTLRSQSSAFASVVLQTHWNNDLVTAWRSAVTSLEGVTAANHPPPSDTEPSPPTHTHQEGGFDTTHTHPEPDPSQGQGPDPSRGQGQRKRRRRQRKR